MGAIADVTWGTAQYYLDDDLQRFSDPYALPGSILRKSHEPHFGKQYVVGTTKSVRAVAHCIYLGVGKLWQLNLNPYMPSVCWTSFRLGDGEQYPQFNKRRHDGFASLTGDHLTLP